MKTTANHTTHTKGPWEVQDPLGPDILSIVEAGKQAHEWRHIATIPSDGEEIYILEAEANARLIAAAPDLLEAAKGALMLLNTRSEWDDCHVSRTLRAAISKAEASK